MSEPHVSNPADRRWYLVFSDEDGGLRGLLGPFKDNTQEHAQVIQHSIQSVDLVVTEAVDWDSPDLRVPVLYHSVQALALDPREVEEIERQGGGLDD